MGSVFVVLHCYPYEGEAFCGVFSSRDKAAKHIEEIATADLYKYTGNDEWYYKGNKSYDYYYISEAEVQ